MFHNPYSMFSKFHIPWFLAMFHTPCFILHTGSVINKVVGSLVGLLGLFLCLFGHRLFDFGKELLVRGS